MSIVFIHPSTVVDVGARLGAGTKVWHFSHLMAGAVVGSNCIIGQNVFIDNNVVIGNGVKIQNNVSIYNGAIIEDDVFIGPSAVFTNVINPRSFIERKDEFAPIIIRKGATIGANATIVCGVEVGSYAFVGAGSVVTRSIPPFSLSFGSPATHRGWVSAAGLRLIFNQMGEAYCSGSGEKYLLRDNTVLPAEAFED
ncbi:MAG TPA: acyltransferase [Flavisolibacter sp.]